MNNVSTGGVLRKAALAALMIVAVTVAYLRFANPLNNKYAFIFQLYYWPGRVELDVGPHYTGPIWKWWRNGNPLVLETFKDGLKHGRWAIWDAAGNVRVDGEFRENREWSGTFFHPVSTGDPPRTPIIITYEAGIPVGARKQDGQAFTGEVADGQGNIFVFSGGRPAGEQRER